MSKIVLSWGMGSGEWGVGIGEWGLGRFLPITNYQ